VFDPKAVAQLWTKCRSRRVEEQFSNADNMALVGVLSTGLLHQQLVRTTPTRSAPGPFLTSIDRLSARNPGNALGERAEPRLAT